MQARGETQAAALAATARLAVRAWRDLAANLRLLSILPLPAAPAGETERPLGAFAWATPLAGALIGALGAVALILAAWLGLPATLSAVAAIAALAFVGGVLHEDGVADFADGLGAKGDAETRLAAMRDSRIGAFGAATLTLALIARIAAVAALAGKGIAPAVAALVLAGAASRLGALVPLTVLPPARADGLGASAGRPAAAEFLAAAATTAAIALVAGLAALGLAHAIVGVALAAAAGLAVSALARARLGGQTGDVAGAAQQAGEIACLVGLLIGAGTT